MIPVIATVAVVWGTPSADSRTRRAPCQSYPKTVVANAQVKVFRVSLDRDSVRRPAGLYACHVGSRRVHFLGQDRSASDEDPGEVRRLRLHGRYIALEERNCSRIECDESMVRLNVRNGNRRRLAEPKHISQALDLELTKNGVLVWIRGERPGVGFEVVRWDGKTLTVLDSGRRDEIRGDSLAISGGRAYWFARNRPMSTTIE